MKLFIDTGAFLALADKSDAFHEAVATAYENVSEQNAQFYTSNYVIDETITLIRVRVSHRAATAFIRNLDSTDIKVLRVTEGDEIAGKGIFIRYKDKEFSYTDCTSFALIDKHGISIVMSLDEHFQQFGYKQHVNHLITK